MKLYHCNFTGFISGALGRVVKALDQSSCGLGFDSSIAGQQKPWASFQSIPPLSTQR